jgi:predicted amidophosphoribosyltransferase
MSHARVLERDRSGRETLWQCSDCGQPFNLGWGSRCNRCIREEERHRELIAALHGAKHD